MLSSSDAPDQFEFIELTDYQLTPCLVGCKDCVAKTEHRCPHDKSGKILALLKTTDIHLIVVSQYYLCPSKFVALMEKLLCFCYRTENRPLKGKSTAIFRYCSCKILKGFDGKILWQQFLMDESYSFLEPNFPCLNPEEDVNTKYNQDIVAYIRDVVCGLLSEKAL